MVFVLVLVVAGFAVPAVARYQNDRQIATDRIRFEQADKEVREVAEAIIAANGTPFKSDFQKSCTKRSVKWEEVDFSCKTYGNIFYAISDENEATKIVDAVKRVSDQRWEYNETKTSQNLSNRPEFTALESDYDRLTGYQLILLNYVSKTLKMNCSVSNILYNPIQPPFIEYPSANSESYILASSLKCGDDAKIAYYPFKD